jgi:hypothetical protein
MEIHSTWVGKGFDDNKLALRTDSGLPQARSIRWVFQKGIQTGFQTHHCRCRRVSICLGNLTMSSILPIIWIVGILIFQYSPDLLFSFLERVKCSTAFFFYSKNQIETHIKGLIEFLTVVVFSRVVFSRCGKRGRLLSPGVVFSRVVIYWFTML